MMQFEEARATLHHGLALVFDLEGLSAFFSNPDIQGFVPSFLNHVSHAVSVTYQGGDSYWTEQDRPTPRILTATHQKFLGDGMLILFTPPDGTERFETTALSRLCNRLWNLQARFSLVAARAGEEIPLDEPVPSRIRFGLALGTLLEFSPVTGAESEFIGYAINLASRLQNYCPDLGFIASARLDLPTELLHGHGYMRVVARRLRGFPREIVVVDEQEYEALGPEVRFDLFDPIG